MFFETPMLRTLCVAVALTTPGPGFAAGGGGNDNDRTPPARTQTTQNCFGERQWDPETRRYVRFTQPVNGVWDPDARRCIRPDKAGYLDSNLLGEAVRELAYAGRHSDAQEVLAQMDQSDGLVLTYWGFTHRKMGNLTAAYAYYQKAIELDPDNLLARSYMGQGYVADGDYAGARAQLREIRARGGRETWAEFSLRNAIRTGVTYSY